MKTPITFNDLKSLIQECWFDYQAAAAKLPSVMRDVVPILWFGDVEEYSKDSKEENKRIVTVAINPSFGEFPQSENDDRLIRFPKAKTLVGKKKLNGSDAKRYYKSMNEYFRTEPYDWFENLNRVLEEFDSSYGGKMNDNTTRYTAVHIDYITPFATKPIWSEIDSNEQRLLERICERYFHALIEILDPDVVLFSVRKDYRDSLLGDNAVLLSDDETLCINKTKDTHKKKVTFQYRVYKKDGRFYVWGQQQGQPFGGPNTEERKKYFGMIKAILGI